VRRVTTRYGTRHSQVADVWRPEGTAGDLPVVVLLHGGFWRQLYTKHLMRRLAAAVVAHGWMAYNVEYRRVGALGSGGWPETFEDVSSAIDALAGMDGVDTRRVVTCGHSAGGHLALWAGSGRPTDGATDGEPHPVRPCAAVSLAGVVDLVAAARQGVGGGAVQGLMGGEPDALAERYALASPAALLPLGIPQVLVHGLADSTVPPSLSADYVGAARAAGDDATFVPLAGAGHMEMIDPAGPALPVLLDTLDRFAAPRP
jgi:acetyl esterase/lipase